MLSRENMISDKLENIITSKYRAHFDSEPIVVFAPGRVNLIGEHTDYNNGYVFPAAINKGIYLAIGKANDQSTILSHDMLDSFSFSVHDDLRPTSNGGWQNYILGVVKQMKTAGRNIGEFNVVFGGDIPIGAGLSSSAALENAIGFGLDLLFDLKFSKHEIIKMSQKAEHEFAGVRCGIMDQFASMMGEKDKAILLDCETLDYSIHPIELNDYTLLLCNSNVDHNLASSEYNIRRSQCEEGVSLLKKYYSEVKSLRDVTLEMIASHKSEFDEIILRRCEYVLEENLRVQQFGQYLDLKKYEEAGSLLFDGHEGMKSKYEITCDEIDFMVDFAKSKDYIAGARMMGGGFGGCTINLIKRVFVEDFIDELGKSYKSKWNIEMTPIQVETSQGVSTIDQKIFA